MRKFYNAVKKYASLYNISIPQVTTIHEVCYLCGLSYGLDIDTITTILHDRYEEELLDWEQRGYTDINVIAMLSEVEYENM
jgi:hypothetical protein